MQVKLNLVVGAVAALLSGAAMSQDMVVKIGHVGPTSGQIAHHVIDRRELIIGLLVRKPRAELVPKPLRRRNCFRHARRTQRRDPQQLFRHIAKPLLCARL